MEPVKPSPSSVVAFTLTAEAEMQGYTVLKLVQNLIDKVEVPK